MTNRRFHLKKCTATRTTRLKLFPLIKTTLSGGGTRTLTLIAFFALSNGKVHFSRPVVTLISPKLKEKQKDLVNEKKFPTDSCMYITHGLHGRNCPKT